MGRRKIEIKAIKDDRNRSVTFLKRKGGLFKKAHELSVLCSVDVAVVIFGNNKKLYQYSSGDIQEILSRHQYYDTPHESKGPTDFKDKNLNDDDDDDDMVPERAGSHSSNDHPLPHHMHAGLHLSNRHAASSSPPNLPKNIVSASSYPMGRVETPQPAMTRPSSRNQIQRRNSSNLVPPNGYPANQPPQTNNAYAYHISHSSVYNPQAPVIPMQQSNLNQMQSYPYNSQQQQQTQQPQTQAQAQAEAYINDTSRRQSLPPTYTSDPTSENDPPIIRSEEVSAASVAKRAPAKSRSMFTPIGPSESMLAQHFGGFGQDHPARSHSGDVAARHRSSSESTAVKTEETSSPSLPPSIKTSPPPPPSRSNSMTDPKSAGMRPKLKVHIPTEVEDAASPAESSPRGSAVTAGNQSARPEGTVVLPPPSPSVGTLLSAGATGPSNPFSRPPPASTQPDQTPMSALPSRFTEAMLPSPSSFYGEWSLPFPQQRNGGNNDNMLPSPLNFQTPVGSNPSGYYKDALDANGNGKRRSPGSDHSDNSVPKRVKT